MTAPDPAPPANTPAEATETAWRIHEALGEWTARVDAKASFADWTVPATVAVRMRDKTVFEAEGPDPPLVDGFVTSRQNRIAAQHRRILGSPRAPRSPWGLKDQCTAVHS